MSEDPIVAAAPQEDIVPQTGTPAASHVSSTSMTDSEGLLSKGDDAAKVTDIPKDSPTIKWEDAQKWLRREKLEEEDKLPDWADMKKYGTIEEQAKANSSAQKMIGELKQQLGVFADWKAPENYDFKEIADDTFKFNTDAPSYNNFIDLLRTHSVPQEFANQLMGFYKTEMTHGRVNQEEELAKLGGNAQEQLDSLTSWAKNNFSEKGVNWIFSHTRTAEDISALKEIRASMVQTQVPTGVNTVSSPVTKETIMKEYSDNLYKGLNIAKDPDLQREWIKKIQEFS